MFRPLVWSATTMGLSAAGYALATVNTRAMPVDPLLVLLTLLLVQSLYLRDWLAGSSGDDDATNQPAKVAWLLRHRSRLRALALVRSAFAVNEIGDWGRLHTHGTSRRQWCMFNA